MSGKALGTVIRSRAAVPIRALMRHRRGPPAPSLTELGRTFGTDKAGVHHYTQHYERHLGPLRGESFTLLEIGIGGYAKEGKGGASLRMWKAFFPRVRVVGLDVQDKSFVDEPGISTYRGSQVDEQVLRRIFDDAGSVGSEVKVVIDDGSHRPEHVRETFRMVFPWLPTGATYVIEDTQTSYWPRYGGSTDRSDPTTSMAMVKDLVDGLNYEEFLDEDYEPTLTDRTVVGVHCYHNLVFIEKGDNEEGTNRHRLMRRVNLLDRRPRRATDHRDAGVFQALPPQALLDDLMGRRPGGRDLRVAVLSRTDDEQWTSAISALGHLELHRVDVADPPRVTHPLLLHAGPLDAFIDASGQADKQVDRFRRYFLYLRVGGVYYAPRPATDDGLWPLADLCEELVVAKRRGAEASIGDDRTPDDDAGLATTVGSVRREADHLVVTQALPVLAKLREGEVNRMLASEPWRGRVLRELDGGILESRCDLHVSSSQRPRRMPRTYEYPPVYLREYVDVVCHRAGSVLQGELVLPDSFRHPRNPRLKMRALRELGPRFAQLAHPDTAISVLEGSYFHLGNEHGGHFGHEITEVLSRTWGWEEAKAADPGIRALVHRRPGREPATWELALYESAGIAPEDVVVYHDAVAVDRLVSATPLLSQPKYVHPAVAEVWRRSGEALSASAPERDYPARVFCSRPGGSKRACHNGKEVEEFFRVRGFAIVHPEEHALPEQAAIFDHAEVVAGFAGSAMVNVFAAREPKHVVLVSPSSYTATNEYLLASVRGDRLSLSISPADREQPERGWDLQAMRSGFTVDLSVEGPWLDEQLSSS